MLSYPLAVLAAFANATASVLQRTANRQEPTERNLSWRLLADLLRRPVWLAGVGAVIVGFLLQATALRHGRLSVVEPILVLELPATLALAGVVFHRRLHLRDWLAALAMTVGVAALLAILDPSPAPHRSLSALTWTIALTVSLGTVALLTAVARLGPVGPRRAALLGIATGVGFGLTAALMKAMTARLAGGWGALFTGWPLYAMIATGLMSMFLLQSALNAGRLLWVQPGITLSDPVVSVLWGTVVFGERVRAGWLVLPAVVAMGLVAAGAVVLARSPLLPEEGAETSTDTSPPGGQAHRSGPGTNPPAWLRGPTGAVRAALDAGPDHERGHPEQSARP